MANTPIIFFFLLPFTFFLQLHARESQFFSKFTKETQLLPTSTDQQEQQPGFIPQTKDSTGYGLYAHQLPPSTTTTNTNSGGTDNLLVSTFPENYNTVAYETTDPQYGSRKKYNGDNTMYNNQKQDRFYHHLPTASNGGTADVTLPENYNPVAYTTPIHGKDSHQTTEQYNMYNSQVDTSGTRFMNGEDMYNSEKQGVRDSRVLDNGKYYQVGDRYNSEKQGMSDTRFMDNGKYYYDQNSESFDANTYANPRGNGYNTRGYYGNNENSHNPRGYYGNNDNSYNSRYNSNAQFQENQEYMFTP